MIRNLGTLILLSAAAFAQTPTTVQTPAATPATVSVTPASHPAQVGKPSPSDTKAGAKKDAPNVKAVPVRTAKASSTPKVKAVATNSATAKRAVVTAKSKPVSAQTAAKTVGSARADKAVSTKPAVAPQAISRAAKPGVLHSVPAANAAAQRPAVSEAKAGSRPQVVSAKTGETPVGAHVAMKAHAKKSSGMKQQANAHVSVAKTKVAAAGSTGAGSAPSVQENKSEADNKPAAQPIHTSGRDPFLSPVVAMGTAGSGCSAGKRCLAIDQIALKGVVKSESGMIAVVTNAIDKAYFLRENDPVFNGYVVKITGDSIIFKETFHDRLGKTLTRDVTKSITRPVA
jgi:hypothetical protein